MGLTGKDRKFYIGVDPGKSGAIAVLNNDALLVFAQRMPIFPGAKGINAYNIVALAAILRRYAHALAILAVEETRVQGMDGRLSIASTHFCGGMVQGIAAGVGMPYEIVTASAWQAKMLHGRPRKSYEDRKRSAVQVALGLFPEIPIKFKADWGLADAALIAEYSRRHGERESNRESDLPRRGSAKGAV